MSGAHTIESGMSLAPRQDLRMEALSPPMRGHAERMLAAITYELAILGVSSLGELQDAVERLEVSEPALARLSSLQRRLYHILDTGSLLRPDWEHLEKTGEFRPHADISDMAVTADGIVIVASDNRTGVNRAPGIHAIKPKDASPIRSINTPGSRNSILGITADDKVIVRSSMESFLYAWDPRTGAVDKFYHLMMEGDERVVWDRYRNQLLISANPAKDIYIFDGSTRQASLTQSLGRPYKKSSLEGVTSNGLYVLKQEGIFTVDPKTNKTVGGRLGAPMTYAASLDNGDVIAQQCDKGESRWFNLWIWRHEKNEWKEFLDVPESNRPAQVVNLLEDPGIVHILHVVNDACALYVADAVQQKTVWSKVIHTKRASPSIPPRLAVSPGGVVYLGDELAVHIFEPMGGAA